MQYILTQAEYDALRSKQEQSLKLSGEKLQQLCIKIATTMPVYFHNGIGENVPWGCKLSPNDYSYIEYCDDCPVQEICPHDGKEWSK